MVYAPHHTHTLEDYWAMKKNEIMPFATTGMDLRGITLIEIRQRKTNTIRFHLYMESKKQANEQAKQNWNRLINTETMGWLLEGRDWGAGQNRSRWLKGTRFLL